MKKMSLLNEKYIPFKRMLARTSNAVDVQLDEMEKKIMSATTILAESVDLKSPEFIEFKANSLVEQSLNILEKQKILQEMATAIHKGKRDFTVQESAMLTGIYNKVFNSIDMDHEGNEVLGIFEAQNSDIPTKNGKYYVKINEDGASTAMKRIFQLKENLLASSSSYYKSIREHNSEGIKISLKTLSLYNIL